MRVVQNRWRSESDAPFERSSILRHDLHPEGLDVDRLRFTATGVLAPDVRVGHVVSITAGGGQLQAKGEPTALAVEPGVHLYLPPGCDARLELLAGTELVHVRAPTEAQSPGRKLLLRNERYVAACAERGRSLRWILTPQYLSRRIFLHHDETLSSRRGHPVSWFHTTMFDVSGLPLNADREPVFKMSYNTRTELNVCYDVEGDARVRAAEHPYEEGEQRWEPWLPLNGESSYHLDEAAGGPEEEWRAAPGTTLERPYRNKHEISITGGYVTLFCLFDPAPTGGECHRPGEYSDYEPLSEVVGTPRHAALRRALARFDAMVDELSIAQARGALDSHRGGEAWRTYLAGVEAQCAVEAKLAEEAAGREKILARWRRSEPER